MKHTTRTEMLFNTTRTTSGPPSTRARPSIANAMDGGVADTTCYYTGLHRPLIGGIE